jgi:hypothetical protein
MNISQLKLEMDSCMDAKKPQHGSIGPRFSFPLPSLVILTGMSSLLLYKCTLNADFGTFRIELTWETFDAPWDSHRPSSLLMIHAFNDCSFARSSHI